MALGAMHMQATLHMAAIVLHMLANVAEASRLISGFQRIGILTEITGRRRNRRFAYEPYIQLFRG
jgi:hypothetical protein